MSSCEEDTQPEIPVQLTTSIAAAEDAARRGWRELTVLVHEVSPAFPLAVLVHVGHRRSLPVETAPRELRCDARVALLLRAQRSSRRKLLYHGACARRVALAGGIPRRVFARSRFAGLSSRVSFHRLNVFFIRRSH